MSSRWTGRPLGHDTAGPVREREKDLPHRCSRDQLRRVRDGDHRKLPRRGHVGGPTAGTNGNIVMTDLPGGYRVESAHQPVRTRSRAAARGVAGRHGHPFLGGTRLVRERGWREAQLIVNLEARRSGDRARPAALLLFLSRSIDLRSMLYCAAVRHVSPLSPFAPVSNLATERATP